MLLISIQAPCFDDEVKQAKTPTAIAQLMPEFNDVTLSALHCADSRVADALSDHFQTIMQTIDEVIESRSLKDKQSLATFLRFMKGWVKAMKSFLKAWEEYYELHEELEIFCAKKSFFLVSARAPCIKTNAWHGFGYNRAEPCTEKVATQGEKQGRDIRVCMQRLPRGSLTVVELWRQDVSAVIESILQVN